MDILQDSALISALIVFLFVLLLCIAGGKFLPDLGITDDELIAYFPENISLSLKDLAHLIEEKLQVPPPLSSLRYRVNLLVFQKKLGKKEDPSDHFFGIESFMSSEKVLKNSKTLFYRI